MEEDTEKYREGEREEEGKGRGRGLGRGGAKKINRGRLRTTVKKKN